MPAFLFKLFKNTFENQDIYEKENLNVTPPLSNFVIYAL